MKSRTRRRWAALIVYLTLAVGDFFPSAGQTFIANAHPVTSQEVVSSSFNCADDAAGLQNTQSQFVTTKARKSPPSPLLLAERSSFTSFLVEPCSVKEHTLEKEERMAEIRRERIPVTYEKDLLPQQLIVKRGEKVNRHLIAGAWSASFACVTATLGIYSNSLRAHDQSKYGVSRKAGLTDDKSGKDKDKDKKKGNGKDDDKDKDKDKDKDDDKSTSNKEKDSADDDDDEPESPSSPKGNRSNITQINNTIYVQASGFPQLGTSDKDNSKKRQIEPDAILRKRNNAAIAAPVKGIQRFGPLLAKIEDYGKMSAATGAVTAAIITAIATTRAHAAYVEKERKKEKKEKEEEEEEEHKSRRSLWTSGEDLHSFQTLHILSAMPQHTDTRIDRGPFMVTEDT